MGKTNPPTSGLGVNLNGYVLNTFSMPYGCIATIKGQGEVKNATMKFSYFLHINVFNAPPSEYAKIFLDYRISF